MTLVLDPAVLGKLELAPGAAAPPFVIDVGSRRVRAQVSAKSLRTAITMILEHGAEQVAVILQGKLEKDDVIAEAGLVAQVKTRRAPQSDPDAAERETASPDS